jgi:hypothetical protein
MAVNVFSYTSRDFDSILSELNRLYPNKPDWFKNSIAGLFAIAHWYLDARAQNNFLSSAFTPQSILNLAAFLDYYPAGVAPGSGQLVVQLDNAVTLPYTFTASQQVFSASNSDTGVSLNLIGIEDVIFTTGRYGKVKVKHGTVVDPFQIGVTNNTEFQEVIFNDRNIQYNTFKAYLATSITPLILTQWSVKDTLVNSLSTDEHVRIIKKPNGFMTLQFGNGEYGKIPPNNTPVYISYVQDGGIIGNFLAGKTVVSASVIGTSTGLPSQAFDIVANVVINDLIIKVNNVTWFRVSSLLNYTSTDRVFTAELEPVTGVYRVTFGDGVNGQIPTATEVITADYNVADNVTISYTGISTSDIIAQYPYEDFTGGSAAETVETTRFMAPLSLKSLEKAVTEEDFEYLTKKYSTSIVRAKPLPLYYGPSTVGVHVLPAGGGDPSTTLKQSLQDFLLQRTPLSVLDVRVRNPIYIPNIYDHNVILRAISITTNLYIKVGYSQSQYFAYGSLVLRLLVSEVTTELLNIYDSEGIASALDFINAKWNFGGYIFTSADYNEITKIFERRIKDGVQLWGGRLRPNDIISGLTDLTGADYAEVLAPTSIITLTFDKIFTDKTMTFNLTVLQ